MSLNSKAAGGGKVVVHLMEGADLLASYVVAVDLSSAKGSWVGGSGGVEDFAEGKDRFRLKFLFRVDDGAMPSVYSARCAKHFIYKCLGGARRVQEGVCMSDGQVRCRCKTAVTIPSLLLTWNMLSIHA